jgi:hypothetical protein
MFDNQVPKLEHGDVTAIAQPQVGIGVDIDLFEVDAKGAELGRHLLAEMAALPAVKPGRAVNLCQ